MATVPLELTGHSYVISRETWSHVPHTFCLECLVLQLGSDLWSDRWLSPFLQTVTWAAALTQQTHPPGPPCSRARADQGLAPDQLASVTQVTAKAHIQPCGPTTEPPSPTEEHISVHKALGGRTRSSDLIRSPDLPSRTGSQLCFVLRAAHLEKLPWARLLPSPAQAASRSRAPRGVSACSPVYRERTGKLRGLRELVPRLRSGAQGQRVTRMWGPARANHTAGGRDIKAQTLPEPPDVPQRATVHTPHLVAWSPDHGVASDQPAVVHGGAATDGDAP